VADDPATLVEAVRFAERTAAALERNDERAATRHAEVVRLHGDHATEHTQLAQEVAEVRDTQAQLLEHAVDAGRRLEQLEQRLPPPAPAPRATGPLQVIASGGERGEPTGPAPLPRATDGELAEVAGSAAGRLAARHLTLRGVATVLAYVLALGGGATAIAQFFAARLGCATPHGEVADDAGVQLGEEIELAPLSEIYAEAHQPPRGHARADAGVKPKGPPAPRRRGNGTDTTVDPDDLEGQSDRAGCASEAALPAKMRRARCR